MALINRQLRMRVGKRGRFIAAIFVYILPRTRTCLFSNGRFRENSLRALTDVLFQASSSAFTYGFYYQ